MRQTTQKIITSVYTKLMVASVLVATAIASSPVSALNAREGADAAQGEDQPSNLFGGTDGGIFSTITEILLFILGAISVIMIIIGGLRYVISGGDSSAITAAKNTILYAIIGLVIAVLAYAVIDFVLEGLAPGGGGGASGGEV